jgi:hypothetical protein
VSSPLRSPSLPPQAPSRRACVEEHAATVDAPVSSAESEPLAPELTAAAVPETSAPAPEPLAHPESLLFRSPRSRFRWSEPAAPAPDAAASDPKFTAAVADPAACVEERAFATADAQVFRAESAAPAPELTDAVAETSARAPSLRRVLKSLLLRPPMLRLRPARKRPQTPTSLLRRRGCCLRHRAGSLR